MREVAKDPEIEKMSVDINRGLEEIQKIRMEVEALRATQAVPYIMQASSPPPPSPQPSPAPTNVFPKLPTVAPRLYSPAHTDKLQSGADALGELIQQSEIARSWAIKEAMEKEKKAQQHHD